jgi:hypothetical protein
VLSEAVLKVLPEIKTAANLDVKVTYDKFKIPIRTTFPYTHEEAFAGRSRQKRL